MRVEDESEHTQTLSCCCNVLYLGTKHSKDKLVKIHQAIHLYFSPMFESYTSKEIENLVLYLLTNLTLL